MKKSELFKLFLSMKNRFKPTICILSALDKTKSDEREREGDYRENASAQIPNDNYYPFYQTTTTLYKINY